MISQRHKKISDSCVRQKADATQTNIRKIRGKCAQNYNILGQYDKTQNLTLSKNTQKQVLIQNNPNFSNSKVEQQKDNTKNKQNTDKAQTQAFIINDNHINKIKPKILSVQELTCKRVGIIQIKQINLINVSSKNKKINLSLSKQDRSNLSLNKNSQKQSYKSSNNSSICKKSKLSLISNKSIRRISTLKINIQNQNQETIHRQKCQNLNLKSINNLVQNNLDIALKQNNVDVTQKQNRRHNFQHRPLKTTRQIKQFKPQNQKQTQKEKKKIKIMKRKYESLQNILDLDIQKSH